MILGIICLFGVVGFILMNIQSKATKAPHNSDMDSMAHIPETKEPVPTKKEDIKLESVQQSVMEDHSLVHLGVDQNGPGPKRAKHV